MSQNRRHRKLVKHNHEPGDFHELTFSCYNSSDLLNRLTIRERPGKTTFRFWQEGPGFDRNLYSTKAIRAAIDYIHMNPVNRGLCDEAVDYKWSSARYYLLELPKQQFSTLPHIHGIPLGTFDGGQPRY